MCNMCRISKLCKENILSTLNKISCNIHSSTDRRLPERHIKYMMKSKWNKSSLNYTKSKCSKITTASNKTAKCINTVLDYRPYKIH